MAEQKCWMCRRTQKESLDEFKEIVIAKLKLSEDPDDKEKLSRLLQENHYPYPSHGDFQQFLFYDMAIDDAGRRYVDDTPDTTSQGEIYGEVYLCPVCSSILCRIGLDACHPLPNQ